MNTQPAPFILASILMSYPMVDSFESVQVLLNDPGVQMAGDLRTLILQRMAPDNLEDLQSEYIDIFDKGRTANPLYETEYDRRRVMAKGNELSDIAGFYKAFGFELDSSAEGMEMLDHVGIELEFYALLLMKQLHLAEIGNEQGVEIVEDGRKNFLQSHLGRFVGAICCRPGVENSDFYRQVFGWGALLIDEECRTLNLQVEQAEWLESSPIKDEEMNCGTGGGCPK